ncbi:MAG: hypothetical protein AAF492_30940 [Verrucomicrobiota bacterium]
MFHGTEDSLLGVDDPNVTPMTGNLYPIYFRLASDAHAAAEGIASPFVFHAIFDLAEHSFDNETIEPEMNWNTMAEDIDEKSKRLARDETLKWFRHCLQPIRLGVARAGNVDDSFFIIVAITQTQTFTVPIFMPDISEVNRDM